MPAPRVRGDGWDAWRDGELVHTRATDVQHGVSAAARVEALSRLVAEGGRGVLCDERRAGGAPSPGALDVLREFVRAHPRLPLAFVAHDHAAQPIADAVKAVPGARVATFRDPGEALAWLRAELARLS
jgi:hypothetical protein